MHTTSFFFYLFKIPIFTCYEYVFETVFLWTLKYAQIQDLWTIWSFRYWLIHLFSNNIL